MRRGIKRKLPDAQLIPSTSAKKRSTAVSPALTIPAPSELSAIELLPTDVLVSIILRNIPVSQWASMESISPRFRDCIHEAWRSLKEIRVFDDLLATAKYFPNKKWCEHVGVRASMGVLNKLSLRAINLKAIGGISKLIQPYNYANGDKMELVCSCLIQFRKMRRFELDMGSERRFDIATFLSMHLGRANLTELILRDSAAIHSFDDNERFVDAFRNDQEGRAPLKLKTIDLRENGRRLGTNSFVQTIDVSRLTTFLISGTFVPRREWSEFVTRAIKLERLGFSFVCGTRGSYKCRTNTVQIILDENVAILNAIGKLNFLESLTIGTFAEDDPFSDTWLQSKLNCGCRDFLQPFAILIRILAARRSADGGERIFKELGFIGHMTEPKFVSLIADYIPDLQALNLDKTLAPQLNEELLGGVLRSQRTLQRLHLNRKQEQTVNIVDLLGNASTLEYLSLTFDGAAFARGDLKELAHFQRLKEFKLVFGGSTSILHPPIALDDSVFSAWANGFGATIRSFEFLGRSNASVNRASLLRFLASTTQLKTLSLRSLTIDDPFLVNLATRCPTIEELYLNGDGAMMTKAGVQNLLDGCTRLKTISFRVTKKDSTLFKDLSLAKYRRVSFKVEIQQIR